MLPNPISFLQEHAPWLLDPKLQVCVVGSAALAEACQRQQLPAPKVNDLDLSWCLEIKEGEALLQQHQVFQATTQANQQRGTLAMKVAGQRLEITSFRGDRTIDDPEQQIEADLAGRDMTIGALAWWLGEDRILDPYGGLQHWQERKVVAVGEVKQRITEHPVRWLRYYRRAQQWGFSLQHEIRKVDLPADTILQAPPEAMASELRSALLDCPSPGRFLAELFEVGLLQAMAPELAAQFDGRPAGPIRHHPEIHQGLHLILALEWMHVRAIALSQKDRAMVMFAVLCHDLGKGNTEAQRLPAHHGHEQDGVAVVDRLLQKLPGLADRPSKQLAQAVCALHTTARNIAELRPGSRAKLYAQYFRRKDFPVDLFALALGADVGGRLDRQAEGEQVAQQVAKDIAWIRTQCSQVDEGQLWSQFGEDKERFQQELHQAWARTLQQYPA